MVIMQVKELAEFPKTFILPSSTHASPESDPVCLVSKMPPITRCRDIVFLLSSGRNNKSHSSHQKAAECQLASSGGTGRGTGSEVAIPL